MIAIAEKCERNETWSEWRRRGWEEKGKNFVASGRSIDKCAELTFSRLSTIGVFHLKFCISLTNQSNLCSMKMYSVIKY